MLPSVSASVPSFVFGLMVWTSLAGCGEATQTILRVDVDEALLAEDSELRLEAYDGDGSLRQTLVLPPAGRTLASVLPFDLPLSAQAGDTSRRWAIRAELRRRNEPLVRLTTRRIGGFEAGRRYASFILGTSCLGVRCNDDEACESGTCVPSCVPLGATLDGAQTACEEHGPTCLSLPAVDVSAGGDHSCALGADGVLRCWGSGLLVLAAADSIWPSFRPRPVYSTNDAMGRVVCGDTEPCVRADWDRVASGGAHACALAAGVGQVYCWGDHGSQQLGVSDPERSGFRPRPTPIRFQDDIQAVQISMGRSRSMARDELGALWFWGDNRNCALGHSCASSSDNGASSPGCDDLSFFQCIMARGGPLPSPLGPFVDGCIADNFSCGVGDNGVVRCWGDTAPLGIGTAGETFPSLAEGAHGIACGARHVCLLLPKGVACVGDDEFGQVSAQGGVETGRFVDLALPVAVEDIFAGDEFSCAFGAAELYCWGNNNLGQLGTSESGPQVRRVPIENVVTAGIGPHHGCAIDTRGEVWCWGANDMAQRGLANVRSEPNRVCF